jgi:phosphoserine phosphatase
VKRLLKIFLIRQTRTKEIKMSKFKLVMFDMDGTLLQGRGIFVIAEKKGFKDELLKKIKDNCIDFYQRSIEIAKLSKGLNKNELIEIFRTIKLHENVENIISTLKKHGIITAIATDSYNVFADDLKERLGIDYTFANNLIMNGDIITGELEIHNKDLTQDFFSGRIYSICKSCALEQLCEKLDIKVEESIAVGDGRVDIGMIKRAGLGIAFNAPDEVKKHADIITNDLSIILNLI